MKGKERHFEVFEYHECGAEESGGVRCKKPIHDLEGEGGREGLERSGKIYESFERICLGNECKGVLSYILIEI